MRTFYRLYKYTNANLIRFGKDKYDSETEAVREADKIVERWKNCFNTEIQIVIIRFKIYLHRPSENKIVDVRGWNELPT